MTDPDIFGLPRSQVQSVLAAACRQTITDYTVRFGKKQSSEGICGEYLLPTFRARTQSAGTVEVPMFIRRQLRKSVGNRQAHHYEFLASRGVPVPSIYGSLIDGEEREIIFLELLDEVHGSDAQLLAQPDYVQKYLGLAASLSAAKSTIDYIGQLGHDLTKRDFVMNWADWLPWSVHILGRIEHRALSGDLGDNLKDYCTRNSAKLAHLRRIAVALMAAVRALPLGLVHGDLRPGNTGWRRQDRQLVLFDFEDIMIDARFYDVAQVLGGPRPLRPGTKSNTDLAELFLDTYAGLSGERVDMRTFLDEIQIAWAARKVNLWEYLPPEVGGPSYDHRAFVGEEERRRDLLQMNLSLLVESAAALSGILDCVA